MSGRCGSGTPTASPPGAAAHRGYLYQAPFIPYFGGSMLGPLLGAAEGAYGDYIESTRVRKSALFRNAVADESRGWTQIRRIHRHAFFREGKLAAHLPPELFRRLCRRRSRS